MRTLRLLRLAPCSAVLSPFLLVIVAAAFVASVLVLMQPALAVVAAVLPLSALAASKALNLAERLEPEVRKFTLLWLVLVFSTLVWRSRTTAQLEENPLDSAGLLRVALVSCAGLCALAWLASARRIPPLPAAVKLLGLYIACAFAAALVSPLPAHALYRALELALGFATVVVALALLGRRAGPTMLRIALGTAAGILVLVWVEALAMPSRAWVELARGAIPYQLQGAVPSFSTNGVGALGGLLAVWGLAQQPASRRDRWRARSAIVVGLLSLAAAQYRTGFVAFLLAGALVLWLRRRHGLMIAALAAALILGWISGPELVSGGKDVFMKGQSPEVLRTLSGRTDYWGAALELASERPLLGWGLNVGGRQALVSVGDEETSTIHSTWMEALVGTGVVGTAFLLLAAVAALRRAWAARGYPDGIPVLGMLVFFLARSLTGTSLELFGIGFLIFAALAVAADQLSRDRARGGAA